MCRAVLDEIIAPEESDMDQEMDDEEPPNIECATCEEMMEEEEEVFFLECGCTHHLTCLLDALESLQTCPMCQQLLHPSDFLGLAEALEEVMNDDMEVDESHNGS